MKSQWGAFAESLLRQAPEVKKSLAEVRSIPATAKGLGKLPTDVLSGVAFGVVGYIGGAFLSSFLPLGTSELKILGIIFGVSSGIILARVFTKGAESESVRFRRKFEDLEELSRHSVQNSPETQRAIEEQKAQLVQQYCSTNNENSQPRDNENEQKPPRSLTYQGDLSQRRLAIDPIKDAVSARLTSKSSKM